MKTVSRRLASSRETIPARLKSSARLLMDIAKILPAFALGALVFIAATGLRAGDVKVKAMAADDYYSLYVTGGGELCGGGKQHRRPVWQ